MKLRIRALNSTQTLRIDINGDSSIQQLRQAIAQAVPLPSRSSSSIRVSLNRVDELSASSPDDSLLSLGIASGDLIFYSFDVSDHADSPTPSHEALGQSSATSAEARSEASGSVPPDCASFEGEEEDEDFGGESMEIDEESGRFPESCFARRLVRVLGEELGNGGADRNLIVRAVHSVLLESGFVRFDSASGKKIEDELRLPSSMASAVSLNYTVPAVLEKNTQSILLKFQSLTHFVNVFASLNNGGSATYRLCLDERRFAPAIASLRGRDGGEESEKELHELWKSVRDELALPLMIDICAQAGLPGPACFSRLPSELQMKILELLPGDDLARTACVCKELSHLSGNNSLWMQKFREEFGPDMKPWRPSNSWKNAFRESRRSKRIKSEIMAAANRRSTQARLSSPLFAPIWGVAPNPLELPRIGGIGGDYDRIPGRVPPPFGRRGLHSRGPFSPNCNFGSRF